MHDRGERVTVNLSYSHKGRKKEEKRVQRVERERSGGRASSSCLLL